MATELEFNLCDSLPFEDSIPHIRTIPIQINKLQTDKGKLKAKDAATFKYLSNSRLMEIKHLDNMIFNNIISTKKPLSNKRNCRAKSTCWRLEINEMDSYDILKNMRSSTNRNNMKLNVVDDIFNDRLDSLLEEDVDHEDLILNQI